jgi:diadenosine tetraphosphate (Ap4A) HIT family hydrolase
MFERYQPDLDAYDIVFLDINPTQYGYALVAPKEHKEQQFSAVMLETAGALKIPDAEKADLAARIGRRMERP